MIAYYMVRILQPLISSIYPATVEIKMHLEEVLVFLIIVHVCQGTEAAILEEFTDVLYKASPEGWL